MATTSLSEEWTKLEHEKAVPNPARSIEEYRTTRAQIGASGQDFLRKDATNPLVEKVHVENTMISLPEVDGYKFPARVYRPALQPRDKKLPLMLYFHGGYWCGGDLNSEDLGCRAMIARGANLVVVSFSYRSVTEVPWQTLFLDAEYSMKWLYSHAEQFGGDPSLGFLICGAEAGAHLTAICTIRAKEKHPLIRVTGQVLIVPTLIAWPDPKIPEDWAKRLQSHKEYANAPVLNEELYELFVNTLNVPDEAKRDGQNFPMWASLEGLPPTYLAMDECDPTRDQGFLYEELLSKAGVKTRVDYYLGLPNMFVQFPQLPTTAIAGFHLSAGVKWLLKPRP